MWVRMSGCMFSSLWRYWSKSNVQWVHEIDLTLSPDGAWVAANLISRRYILLFKKRYDWITSCRLLHCLVYRHTFSDMNHPFFCYYFMFFCVLARFLNNHRELIHRGFLIEVPTSFSSIEKLAKKMANCSYWEAPRQKNSGGHARFFFLIAPVPTSSHTMISTVCLIRNLSQCDAGSSACQIYSGLVPKGAPKNEMREFWRCQAGFCGRRGGELCVHSLPFLREWSSYLSSSLCIVFWKAKGPFDSECTGLYIEHCTTPVGTERGIYVEYVISVVEYSSILRWFYIEISVLA